jgi:nitrogen fixation NifU-like protein
MPPTTYGATILEHFRRPRNQGALPTADVVREGANPLCGDWLRLELAMTDAEGGRAIAEARFTANACAVSVAAASILTERVRGLSAADAESLPEGELLRALDAELPAPRLRCALLPLVVLREALAEAGRAMPPARPRPATA